MNIKTDCSILQKSDEHRNKKMIDLSSSNIPHTASDKIFPLKKR